MKVKFSHKFYNHTGNFIKGNDGAIASLESVAVECLLYPTEKEAQSMNGSEKCKRHDLAVQIMNFKDEAEVTSEDITILKTLIGERYIPSVVAQSYAVLESRELPVYPKKEPVELT